jgi:hypothetical protein
MPPGEENDHTQLHRPFAIAPTDAAARPNCSAPKSVFGFRRNGETAELALERVKVEP